jgi:hypothetical protein
LSQTTSSRVELLGEGDLALKLLSLGLGGDLQATTEDDVDVDVVLLFIVMGLTMFTPMWLRTS